MDLFVLFQFAQKRSVILHVHGCMLDRCACWLARSWKSGKLGWVLAPIYIYICIYIYIYIWRNQLKRILKWTAVTSSRERSETRLQLLLPPLFCYCCCYHTCQPIQFTTTKYFFLSIILGGYGHIGKWIQENIIFMRFCCCFKLNKKNEKLSNKQPTHAIAKCTLTGLVQ